LHKNEQDCIIEAKSAGHVLGSPFSLSYILFNLYGICIFIFTLISALPDKSFKELAASDVAKYLKSLVEVNMSFIPYESQVANPWWW
jgi:hypothetical protein